MMKRPLTEIEKTVISRMAGRLSDNQRTQIISDLVNSTVKPKNYDGSIIEFEISGYQRPSFVGAHKLIEGTLKDADGAHLTVILFADPNGRLYEFEIVRYADGEISGPDWSTLSFY